MKPYWSLARRAVRVGSRLLAPAAAVWLATVLAPGAWAQTWEQLPLIPDRTGQDVSALGFLRGEGPAATDPAVDSLVIFQPNGTFLYNPSGAGGAAGANGEWGAWHRLCTGNGCAAPDYGLVTSAGSVVLNSQRYSRATNRGRTWDFGIEIFGPGPLFESSVPVLFTGAGSQGETARSLADGAAGTWAPAGFGFGYPQSFGEVPPSPSFPNGRILIGVWNGALYSDDGGLSYTPSNAYRQAAYIVWSFTFAPQPGHPYGGVVYAGMQNVALFPEPGAEVHRSDDGGRTWALAHRFTIEETGQTTINGANLARAVLLATPDGALWAGAGLNNGTSVPFRGGIMRSTDGGTTWARADTGFAGPDGRGYRVRQLMLSRTGVLYAATDRGVWRTTTAVVAAEASPVEALGIAVSVRPNPAGGRVEVVLTLAAAQTVRVVVLDALGREVAVVLDWQTAAGERVASVETGAWPSGVYVVRATAGAQVASARLVVAR